MNIQPITRIVARRLSRFCIGAALTALPALSALPGTTAAEPGAATPQAVAATPTHAWCTAYERQLLGLVSDVTDSVLFNLRLAMEEAGAGPAQEERVLSLAKHPFIAARVEERHGGAVLGRYEGLLVAVGCLKR